MQTNEREKPPTGQGRGQRDIATSTASISTQNSTSLECTGQQQPSSREREAICRFYSFLLMLAERDK